jgi:hypothetical protein
MIHEMCSITFDLKEKMRTLMSCLLELVDMLYLIQRTAV